MTMPIPLHFCLALTVVFIGWVQPGCSPKTDVSVASADRTTDHAYVTGLPYDLSSPLVAFTLPSRLNEVSGQSFLSDSVLVAIEDERGRIYQISATSGEVIGHVTFAGSGDYEDIAVVGSVAYVLRSDGVVFRVALDSAEPESERFETSLSENDDTEGLAFDARSRSLLIAPKERSGSAVSIYRFELESGSLIDSPWLTLPEATLEPVLKRIGRKSKDFKPSAIAVDVRSDDIYLLSSTGKALLITSRDGEIRHAVALDDDRLRQPEGLAFNENGDLYISSEARGKKAWILGYARVNPK